VSTGAVTRRQRQQGVCRGSPTADRDVYDRGYIVLAS